MSSESAGTVGAQGIEAEASGGTSVINIENHGDLTVIGVTTGDGSTVQSEGIFARPLVGGGDSIIIENHGDLTVTSTATGAGASAAARGIFAIPTSSGGGDTIGIVNYGNLLVTASGEASLAVGIDASAGGDSSIGIMNGGALTVTAGDSAYGILAQSNGLNSDIFVGNNAVVAVVAGDNSYGIFARTGQSGIPSDDSDITIVNTGNFALTAGDSAEGIHAIAFDARSEIFIVNTGNLGVAASTGVFGIRARTAETASPITIGNSGNVVATADIDLAVGIGAYTGLETNSPISITNTGDIAAAAVESAHAIGIDAATYGSNSSIDIKNSGYIAATVFVDASGAYGLRASTHHLNTSIHIENEGNIAVAGTGNAFYAAGIAAFIETVPLVASGPIVIENSGDLAVAAAGSGIIANGIAAQSGAILFPTDNSDITIFNSGDIAAAAGDGNGNRVFGINASTFGSNNITIENAGDIAAAVGNGSSTYAYGISGVVQGGNSQLTIENSGDIAVTLGTGFRAYGLRAIASGGNNPIIIENSGNIAAIAAISANRVYGIYAYTFNQPGSPITIANSGKIIAINPTGDASGINAFTQFTVTNGDISIENTAAIEVTAGSIGYGINASAFGEGSSISIVNSGDITVKTADADSFAIGITARTSFNTSYRIIDIVNRGSIDSAGVGILAVNAGIGGTFNPIIIANHAPILSQGDGIFAETYGASSGITIVNTSDILAREGEFFSGDGIYAFTHNDGSPVLVSNAGLIDAEDDAINAISLGAASSVTVANSGALFGGDSGIYAYSNTETTILNAGSIAAASELAIDAKGASTTIYNTGRITGFVDLTDEADRFFNQAGGVFETKQTSDFGGGNDLFRNAGGGTVLAATHAGVAEISGFANLERFENRGLITMVDGREGDAFFITGPLDKEIDFAASGNSTLAIDAFLGGPGSEADNFLINGNVSGQTLLQVNNTNWGPGQANAVIPVVDIAGNVKSDAFYLTQPIDTGFFNYDLFFRPTGSGIFELRSFVGGGAFLLPQLITATQDVWHAGSSTWFDRTADLRVLLAGGGSPIAYDPTAKYADAVPAGPAAFTPAVWARGGGNWLDRDGSESVNAFGNNYRYKLDRDLEILDWQMGLDLGKRDFLSQGDILVFGVLGGFVNADLDYDQLARAFDFEGGQIGGYATYLRGGLFVDTLLNVHLLDLETATLGFPGSLDATTVGLRTDTGYRFGSFNGGAFIEPLATLSVLWADIDGFSLGGNTVSFDDEANVRGRLGLRVGTSYPAWTGTTIEPFVIGSLWGNLSGDNQATLTSSGTTFRFEDDLDDVWGEVSAGVNFFNPSAATAVFAKIDVTFGDDVDGIGGKAGMRVSW